MKTVSTYCRICEPQCGLSAELDPNTEHVVRLLPDKAHPVHRGFACHKGLNYVQLHHDPDRLNQPQGKTERGFEPLAWEDAIAQIGQRITDLQTAHGEQALAFYVGNPSALNSNGREAARQFGQALGMQYRFGSGTQDCTNKFAASEAMFGTANLHPIPDFAHTHYLLSLGANPRVSHASFVHMTDPMQALRDIVSRGGVVKHINPRQIESASSKTGEVVQIKPDTDVYLLAAMLESIHRHDLVDHEWLNQHAHNVAELWEFVADYPAERVANAVGISIEAIQSLAGEFASAPSASVHMSTGVNMGRQGTLAYWLLYMLSLVTGNLGRRGGNIYSPGYFAAASVGKPQGNPFFDSPFGEMRKITGSLPGNLLADHIERGLVKGLICMSGNPLLSMAGEGRLREALQQLELLVVIDIYPNATGAEADFLLPATDWLEREDVNSLSLGFQPEPYVQYTPAVVQPQHERRPEWWIFAKLLQSLDKPSALDQPDFNPMAKVDRQLQRSDMSLAALQQSPSQTIRLPDPTPELLFELGVQGSEGKVNAFPELMDKGRARCRAEFEDLLAEPDNQLKLITLRTNYMVNSWMHNLPALKRDQALDNPLHMHPDDATRLGLSDRSEVRVQSDSGALIATLQCDERLRPGVVAMTHGWGHGSNKALSTASNHPGVNVNELLPTGLGSYDPLSNMSHMTGIKVTVAAA